LAALVFVIPLVLLYEAGTWWFHLDASGRSETRILAFNWIRQAFAHFGAHGSVLAPGAVVTLLLGWHVFARHPWRLRGTVPLAMAGESALLSLPLILLVGMMTGTHLLQRPSADEWAAMAVLGIGAGIYEELIFRLVAFALLHALLVDLMALRPAAALTVTITVTSFAFAGYHHIGTGEPFTVAAFAFRTAAGVWLGLVFAARGFGLAAGAHAAYDVLLITLTGAIAPA
jgi:hypothetical protein